MTLILLALIFEFQVWKNCSHSTCNLSAIGQLMLLSPALAMHTELIPDHAIHLVGVEYGGNVILDPELTLLILFPLQLSHRLKACSVCG